MIYRQLTNCFHMISQQSHSAAKGCKTIQFGLLGPGGQLHPTSSPRHCPISAEIRTVDGQSDLRILL